MAAVGGYIRQLATHIKALLAANGGPILMVQIENEYGSFGNDKNYLEELRRLWRENGVDGPFFTADGPTPYMLEAGNIDGAAIGLDSGSSEKAFAQAAVRNPNVPAFSSETYPGWLTHWGEPWARPGVDGLLREVTFLLEHGKSFNFYVIHGGTNFGFAAGANSGGKGYEPDVTSYDYDAPINEQGRPTQKYLALRALISKYIGKLDRREGQDTIDLPKSDAPYPVLEILVEAMGRINFAQHMIDRKGITDRVTLHGMTLMNWEAYKLPFDAKYIQDLKQAPIDAARRGVFFRGAFDMDAPADTYIDMANYQKGIVWINGHNLGRYWEIGPQRRLYCPALVALSPLPDPCLLPLFV